MTKNLLDAVNGLLAARENDMLTSAEWNALQAAALQANREAGTAYASFSVDVTYAGGDCRSNRGSHSDPPSPRGRSPGR